MRNGPPYPLDSNKSTGNRLKTDKLAKGIDSDTASMILGAATFAAVSIGYGMHVRNKPLRDAKRNRKQNLENGVTFDNLPKKSKPMSEEEDVSLINPSGGTVNCTLCTVAYDMRRRGYDVEANISRIGRYGYDVAKYYNLKKNDIKMVMQDDKNLTKLKAQFDAYPPDSRGYIEADVFTGFSYSRHAMIWEKKGGKLYIRDGQVNENYDDIMKSRVGSASRNRFTVFRTDNAEPNKELIMDAVTKRR